MSSYVDHAYRHLPGGTDPLPFPTSGTVIYEIKIDPDDTSPIVANGRHVFAIPEDLDGWELTAAHGWVSTVSSSGSILVQIHNATTGNDMLNDLILIDVSEFTSYTAGTESTVVGIYAAVSTGDLIRIDCDADGTGARGLGVILTFTAPA
jgi:hypothetical protein